ncbi:MAG TPA: hypothetical protein VGH80_04620 [Xanthomonadaceae bacterium]|jgi:hypothetical protein
MSIELANFPATDLDKPTIRRTRSAGIAIATAAVVSTIFVALDRSGGGTTPREILQGIAGLENLKELVHAVAIASVCGMAFGFAALARRLGMHRPEVLAGLVFYLLGCVAMIGATILDGFVTPHVAVDAIQTATSPERVAFAYNLVHYLNLVLNDLAKLGWVLQAAGTFAWSATLLRDRGFSRATGAVGVVSSALVLGLIATSSTSLTMTALLSILVAQLAWNLAAGLLLIRDPSTVA